MATRKQPEFARPEPARPWRRLLAWLAVPALALVLALQVTVADRDRLAADATWRPRVAWLCGWLHCRLPPWHEPGAFHVTSREVRPHPAVPGALLISASFRNDAAFAQAWPQLEMSLSDLDGQSLGLRRFSPREYLGSAPPQALIAPGQSASITLELLDPGKRAVTFSLDFR